MRTSAALLLIFFVCIAVRAQRKRPMPVIQTIGDGVVSKESVGIIIENVFGFKTKPVIGERVTVIALGSGISPFDLRILKAELKDGCDESSPRWWDVKLEPVTVKKLFDAPTPSNRNAQYPFDVVILYPAVKFARQLTKAQFDLASLPKGTYLNTVKAAIDLDNDRKPDIVITEYCCNDRKKAPSECDLTCGKTFKKLKNVWKLVDTLAPC